VTWTVDYRRYKRAATLTAALALALRAGSLPASWSFSEQGITRLKPQFRNGTRHTYRTVKQFGLALAVRDAVLGRLAPGTIASVGVADYLSAKCLRGFAPYTDHLYVHCAALTAMERAGGAVKGAPTSAYLPHVIYFAAGISKLRESPASWIVTGDIVSNAVDLYAWNFIGQSIRRIPAVWLARTALAYELLALPTAVLGGIKWLRINSFAGLLFHIINYSTLRISFWHHAVLHLPILVSTRWDSSTQRPD